MVSGFKSLLIKIPSGIKRFFRDRYSAKINIIGVLIFLLLLMGLADFILNSLERSLRKGALKDLNRILDSTHNLLTNVWLKGHFADASIVVEDKDLRVNIEKLLAGPGEGETENSIKDYLNNILNRHDFIGMVVISTDCKEILSIKEGEYNFNVESPYYRGFLQRVFNGESILIPPAPVEDGGNSGIYQPVMVIGVPVKTIDHKIAGAFGLIIDPYRDFSLLANSGKAGKSGETYVFGSRGEMLSGSRFNDQLRSIGVIGSDKGSIMNVTIRDPGVDLLKGEVPSISVEKQPFTFMVQEALKNRKGSSAESYRDYRGVPVLGAWLWDDNLGMGFATEIDEEEVLKPYKYARSLGMSIFGVLSLLVIIFVWLVVINQQRATARVYDSENYLKTVLDGAVDAIITTNSEGNIEIFNSSAEEMFGYSQKEVNGLHINNLLDGIEGFDELVCKDKGGKICKSWEVSGTRKDGGVFPVRLGFSRAEAGNQKFIIGIIHDLTRNKEAEKALQISQEQYRMTFDNASIGIFNLDSSCSFVNVNKQLCNMFLYSKDDMLKLTVFDVVHPGGITVFKEELRRKVDDEDGCCLIEKRFLRKEGSEFWGNLTVAVQKDCAGDVEYYIATLVDITKSKDYEEELRIRSDELESANRDMEKSRQDAMDNMYVATMEKGRSEEALLELQHSTNQLKKLSRAIDQSPATVVITDNRGNIEYVNPHFTITTGFEAEEAVGENPRMLKSGNMAEEFYSKMWDTIRSGNIWRGEFENRKKNGEIYWESASISPILDDNGDITHYVAVKEDITEQRRIQEEVKASKESAEAATRAKSEFLANMSHEIRTPMNAIIGMNYLMLKTGLSEKQKDYAEKIRRSANSLLGIINDILDFSKIEAGKLNIENIDFSLMEVMETLSDVTAIKAQEKGLELVFDIESEEKIPVHLTGDPLRLGQILLNLTNNAVKFTDKGEIVISVSSLKKSKDEILLNFSVKDSGIGISEEQKGRLFQSFQQADTTITRKYGGTGLGLAICSELVKMMGGEIEVESREEEGSTFSFTASFGYREEKKSFILPSDIRGMKALVVDDNYISREIFKKMLKAFSFDVESVNSGFEALVGLNKTDYDLMIVDWKMPEMDGISLVKRVKEIYSEHSIPKMIMATAYGWDSVVIDARTAGVDAFIKKPVNPSLLFNTIMKTFGKKSGKEEMVFKEDSYRDSFKGKLKGKKILLVEDNHLNQQIALEFLSGTGVDVSVCSNGVEGVEAVKNGKFDLVLMDVQMPEMDGYEATNLIRGFKNPNQLPVIAMTANAMVEDYKKSQEAGMNDHVTKPIDPANLFGVLYKWLLPEEAFPPEIPKTEEISTASGTDSIPPISGINTIEGVKRIGGNVHKYFKLLEKFMVNNEDFMETFEGGDKEKREAMLHSLKGVAGNIGATSLYEIVKEMEISVRRGKNREINDLKTILEGQLKGLLESIRISLGTIKSFIGAEGGKDIVDIGQLKDGLEKFRSRLKNYDASCVEIFRDIKVLLNREGFGMDAIKIERSLGRYDFDEVLDHLEELEKKFP